MLRGLLVLVGNVEHAFDVVMCFVCSTTFLVERSGVVFSML